MFISTKTSCLDTLEGDGWVNKEWGLGTVYKIDKENTLPTWFQAKRDIFIIKEILDDRGKGKAAEYLIRWAGYSQDWDTWEPQINILGDGAIDRYNQHCEESVVDGYEDDAEDDEDYDVESVESNGSDIETISETLQDDVESIGSDSETKSTSCDSTVRNLRLKTASLKRAYYQARQCMYASMQNAKDELNAASCVFMQLTHPENRVSGNNSRKRLRCDVDIVINDLRTILDTQFVSMIE